MESKYITVKLECIETPKEFENGEAPSKNHDEPEFVNIKTENDVPGLDTRVKIEGVSDEESLDPEDPEDPPPWHLSGLTEVLPANCVDVIVKSEPDDCQNGVDNPFFDQPTTSYNDIQAGDEAPGFVCPLCQKMFSTNSNLQRHLTLHSRDKYQCDACPKQFLRKAMLDKHTLNHADRAYECESCDKKFKSQSNLRQHERIHMPEKAYYCDICHRSFAIRSNFLKHQGKSRCKRPADEPIVCNVCNKVFKKEFLLKSHLRRHETAKPFSCTHCDMKFKYKSTLLRHIQLHEGVRPYACPHCDKTFTHSGLLKPHVRVHTGEKPYSCPVCQKQFAHKHNMQRHALRHNKIKHLVCDVCHKKFPKESRLKYHMRIHMNEKYFSCYMCPKKFSHRQNVLRHYSRKHPNATYDCKDTDASVSLKVWNDVVKSKYEEKPEEILG